jgi:hypothetical protein
VHSCIILYLPLTHILECSSYPVPRVAPTWVTRRKPSRRRLPSPPGAPIVAAAIGLSAVMVAPASEGGAGELRWTRRSSPTQGWAARLCGDAMVVAAAAVAVAACGGAVESGAAAATSCDGGGRVGPIWASWAVVCACLLRLL